MFRLREDAGLGNVTGKFGLTVVDDGIYPVLFNGCRGRNPGGVSLVDRRRSMASATRSTAFRRDVAGQAEGKYSGK